MRIGIGDGANVHTIDMAVLDGSAIARRCVYISCDSTDILFTSYIVAINGEVLHHGVLAESSEQAQIIIFGFVDSQVIDGILVTIEGATETLISIFNASTDSGMRCRQGDGGCQLKGLT